MSGNVIVPSNGFAAIQRAPMADLRVRKGLVVARDSDKKPKYICLLCAANGVRQVYYEGEDRAYEQHAAKFHDDADIDAYRQKTSLRRKAPHLYDPLVAGDTELGEWIDKNREAIIAGEKLIGGTGTAAAAKRRARRR